MEFACCKSDISDVDDPLVCTSCDREFHISCVLPNRSSNWEPNEGIRQFWRCPSCSSNSPSNNNNDDTPVRNITKRRTKDKYTKPGASFNGSSATETSINEFRQIIRSEIKDAFCDFHKILEDVKTEITTVQNSLQFMSENYDLVLTRLEAIESKVKYYDTIKTDMAHMNKSIELIQSDINKKEQWARRSNIEVIGVPESNSENLMDLVRKLSDLINYESCINNDIDFITRVTPKTNNTKKSRPIVMRFLSRYKKDDFLARLREKKLLKAFILGYAGNSANIYFNDHLTSSNKMLLRKTKDMAREKHYKYVWVKNCSILLRKNDTSPVLHINTEDDLKKN